MHAGVCEYARKAHPPTHPHTHTHTHTHTLTHTHTHTHTLGGCAACQCRSPAQNEAGLYGVLLLRQQRSRFSPDCDPAPAKKGRHVSAFVLAYLTRACALSRINLYIHTNIHENTHAHTRVDTCPCVRTCTGRKCWKGESRAARPLLHTGVSFLPKAKLRELKRSRGKRCPSAWRS